MVSTQRVPRSSISGVNGQVGMTSMDAPEREARARPAGAGIRFEPTATAARSSSMFAWTFSAAISTFRQPGASVTQASVSRIQWSRTAEAAGRRSTP